ncbi:hypothetical protein NDU88_002419 [Pleurodeles waltl]|uniref:Uncharacterized protein n=1 Tax=Pleurodeles waltl TaxID=8319 RepID=A0AAV7NDP3_PLEWA|nr:hypothetical protein NDU88_002419 [Pleurodeles waltl]
MRQCATGSLTLSVSASLGILLEEPFDLFQVFHNGDGIILYFRNVALSTIQTGSVAVNAFTDKIKAAGQCISGNRWT